MQNFGADSGKTDLLILTTSHQDILLVLVGVELGHEEHLALTERADDLPCLSIPQLDDFVVASTQELAAIVAELDVFDTLHTSEVA